MSVDRRCARMNIAEKVGRKPDKGSILQSKLKKKKKADG